MCACATACYEAIVATLTLSIYANRIFVGGVGVRATSTLLAAIEIKLGRIERPEACIGLVFSFASRQP